MEGHITKQLKKCQWCGQGGGNDINKVAGVCCSAIVPILATIASGSGSQFAELVRQTVFPVDNMFSNKGDWRTEYTTWNAHHPKTTQSDFHKPILDLWTLGPLICRRHSGAVVWFRPVFTLYLSNPEPDHGSGLTTSPNVGPDHLERFDAVRFWFCTGSNRQTRQI
jgi:hypothetical protein